MGVHAVHRVLGVCALGRGHGLDAGGDFADQRFANAKNTSDISVRFALLKQFLDILVLCLGIVLGTLPQVVILRGELSEGEVDVAVDLNDLIDHDVVGVVAEFAGADLELLDVAQGVVLGGFADGEDGVEEVVEFLGAGEVVLGDGAGEGSFGRVGDDQQGPAVLLLEVHQFHHEDAGVHAFVGGVAEVGQVVDDGDLALEFEHGVLDVLEDLLFVVFDVKGHRVDLGSVEARWELVQEAGFGIGVAHLELLVGEFAVDQEDILGQGDVFGHLDSVDGLAQVGVGEEAADLSFVPEFVVEGVGIRSQTSVGEGSVGCLDGEHADVLARGRSLDFSRYGLDGIVLHSALLLLVLVAEDLVRLDRFVEFVSVDEGLALNLE